MRRYVIACEFFRADSAMETADRIFRLANDYQHPVAGIWLIGSALSASEIRSALLPHLSLRDRIVISEAGSSSQLLSRREDGKPAGEERARSSLLTSVLSRSRHPQHFGAFSRFC
jgi:hypothetical protein